MTFSDSLLKGASKNLKIDFQLHMNDYLKKHNYAFALIICTIYQLLFYKYGLNLWDEGSLAYGALRFLNGEIPLIDFGFDGYPPGRYLLAALFFKIFGINLVSIRLLFIILTSFMVVLFYLVSRNFMDKNFALISSLLLLSAPSMYYNRFFPICTVINIYFITRYINSKLKFDLALSIIAIFLTFLIKVEIGIISLLILSFVLVFHMFFYYKNRSINFKSLHFIYKLLLAGVIILIAGFTATAIKIHLPSKIFTFVFQIYSVWGNPFPSLFPSQGEAFPSFQELFNLSLYYLPVMVYILTFILLLKRKMFSYNDTVLNKGNLQILVVLLFGIGTYGLVVWRVGFDNLLRVLPAFYILLCYFLFLFYKNIIQKRIHVNWLNSRNSVKNFFLSVPVLFFPAIFIVNFNFYHGFYAGSIGELRNNHLYVNFDRARIFADPLEAMWVEDVVSYINRTTKANETIFALPLNPIWYFLSDRQNPTSYDWILPQTMRILGEEQKIIDQLNKNRPKLIIYADIAIDGREERRLSNYAPGVFNFITSNYELARIIGPFQILIRRS